LEHFDLYTVKARLAPAIIAVAPSIALLIAILDLQSFDASHVWASIGLIVVLFALSNVSRDAGKKVQNRVYRDNDGWPTFDPIYYSDRTFSDNAKSRYLTFLAEKLGRPYPSMQDVIENPVSAKQFYNEAATWLREATRDTNQFRIIYEENIAYGYYRNLLGLKWVSLFLNFAVMVICILVIFKYIPWFSNQEASLRYVLLVSSIHALYLIFGVTTGRMKDASKRYARQLLLACESLISKT
jgi:hypothetical protein